MIEIPLAVWEAAITLAGAEYRLRDWHVQGGSDDEDAQIDHLRSIASQASEVVRKHYLSTRTTK